MNVPLMEVLDHVAMEQLVITILDLTDVYVKRDGLADIAKTVS